MTTRPGKLIGRATLGGLRFEVRVEEDERGCFIMLYDGLGCPTTLQVGESEDLRKLLYRAERHFTEGTP